MVIEHKKVYMFCKANQWFLQIYLHKLGKDKSDQRLKGKYLFSVRKYDKKHI